MAAKFKKSRKQLKVTSKLTDADLERMAQGLVNRNLCTRAILTRSFMNKNRVKGHHLENFTTRERK